MTNAVGLKPVVVKLTPRKFHFSAAKMLVRRLDGNENFRLSLVHDLLAIEISIQSIVSFKTRISN